MDFRSMDLSSIIMTARHFTVQTQFGPRNFKDAERTVRVHNQVLYVGDEHGMLAMFSPPWEILTAMEKS